MIEHTAPAGDRRLFLVDGANAFFRAFHAIRAPMHTPDGIPSNALYGFARMTLQLFRAYDPHRLVYVFDAHGPTFRDELYPQYKAQRSPMPEELRVQLPLIAEFLDVLGVARVERQGFEADDLIGTMTTMYRHRFDAVWIVSGDKDLMQLVGGNVRQLDSMNEKLYDAAAVEEKWGVRPDQITDLLGIMGDSSDNIPGIPGIGKKGAAQLLNEWHNLENVLANVERIKPGTRQQQSLRDFANQGRAGKQLATLVLDMPLPEGEDLLSKVPEVGDEWDRFARRVGFGRLAQEFREQFRRSHESGSPLPEGSPATATASGRELAAVPEKTAEEYGDTLLFAPRGRQPVNPPAYQPVNPPAYGQSAGVQAAPTVPTRTLHWQWKVVSETDLPEVLAQLQNPVIFDLETTSLDPLQATILGVALADSSSAALYLPIREGRLPDLFVQWLQKPELRLGGQNLKYDLSVLQANGYALPNVAEDSLIAHALVYPEATTHKLDVMAEQILQHRMISFQEVTGDTLDFSSVAVDRAAEYATEDAVACARIVQILLPKLREQGQEELYRRIEMPLIPILARMECIGIHLDLERLDAVGRALHQGLEETVAAISGYANGEFNLNSTQQMGEFLFGQLGLTPPKGATKTKAGGYSTKAEVLENMVEDHPVIPLILEYRKLEKLRNTYVVPLADMVNKGSGRVHTSYHQLGAATGRMSSSDPNLQNIPVRDRWGKMVRSAFVAESGYRLLSIDYSQIELRLFADIACDPGLIEAFRSGDDIHSRTAQQMFGLLPGMVSAEHRRRAKTLNFGLLYGMGARRLAGELGIKQNEAKELIETYFHQFPRIKEGMQEILVEARKNGFVRTMFGRIRPTPDIDSYSPMLRTRAERMAVNAPVQGAAADIIKLAMIAVDTLIREQYPSVRLLLQVHDELLFEVPEEWLDSFTPAAVAAMEGVAELRVPLTVEAGSAYNWADAH